MGGQNLSPKERSTRECRHCKEAHSLHRRFQIYKYSYQDVFRHAELHKYFDCSKIQTYISNNERILHLKPPPSMLILATSLNLKKPPYQQDKSPVARLKNVESTYKMSVIASAPLHATSHCFHRRPKTKVKINVGKISPAPKRKERGKMMTPMRYFAFKALSFVANLMGFDVYERSGVGVGGAITSSFNNKGNGTQIFRNATIIITGGCCMLRDDDGDGDGIGISIYRCVFPTFLFLARGPSTCCTTGQWSSQPEINKRLQAESS